jgi:triacylglycerol lipase
VELDRDLARLTARLSRLAYLSPSDVAAGAADLGLGEEQHFSGLSTQAFTATTVERRFLVFRGTEATNPADWARDAQFQPIAGQVSGRVHSGFRDALDEVWSAIEVDLAGSTAPVVITGHSLGAALATLAAARLSQAGTPVETVHTYGQPRTGLRDFAAAYNSMLGTVTFRFVNHIDLVTRVPLLLQGYRHVGRLMYFDQSGGFHPDASLWKVASDDLSYRMRHFRRIKAIGILPHEIGDYIRLVDRL